MTKTYKCGDPGYPTGARIDPVNLEIADGDVHSITLKRKLRKSEHFGRLRFSLYLQNGRQWISGICKLRYPSEIRRAPYDSPYRRLIRSGILDCTRVPESIRPVGKSREIGIYPISPNNGKPGNRKISTDWNSRYNIKNGLPGNRTTGKSRFSRYLGGAHRILHVGDL